MTGNSANEFSGGQAEFCHLHVHSEYSLSDGAISIKGLVKKVKSLGHEAVAITDHGNMYGAVEFYQACKDAGIKPILGCEIYHEASASTAQILADEWDKPGKDAMHLVLLAKTTHGYHSLIKLVSYGYLHGKNDSVPVIPYDDVIHQAAELIALSAGLKGTFGRLVSKLCQLTKDPLGAITKPTTDTQEIVAAIRSHIDTMQGVFGAENFYVEINDNNIPSQKRLNPILISIAQYLGVPVVATGNCHYLEKDFAKAHAVLVGIRNDLTLSKMRSRRQDATFHLYNNEEMQQLFGMYEDALANTRKIAAQCDVTLVFGKFFLPDFELGGEDINKALIRISKEGLEERLVFLRQHYGASFTREDEKIYWDRLDYEVSIILKMGFPGYFLIVQDFINWAKDHDIPVGPGRGSGAGSIVAYAMRITDLDPIHLNLIFERFLNPERISMPDFDVDFCQSRRDEVIQYVTRKYSPENVAQITTFGKLKAKAALRDVGRVLEVSYSRVDRIAKLVPNELDITLTKALEDEPRLLEEGASDPLIQEMIDIALKIEGLSRHTSVHAAGVVISNGPMENFVPVYKTEDSSLITQYEMKNAEKVGLVKFDFLGLKTLTVIKKAVDIIHRTTVKHDFQIETIDLEDAKTYRDISSGNTCAIFQLESSGMQALNMKLKPSCFEDIIAVVALFRPGPLQSGMVDDFIERKHGRQDIVYLVPELEEILKDTYGIILYQEQVQKIAASIASYSLGEADLLRRAMGKKKPEEMAKQKSRFLSGANDNKIDPKIADELFELMAKFAAYGFNKSHSAAYGLVSYQTAYLKSHFPEQFMAAIMTCDMDNSDKLTRYIEECKRLKFKVLAPDINLSVMEFDVPEPKIITFALSAIKGIGAASIEPILKDRDERGHFRSLTDLAKRVDLHKVGKKTLELLNEAGAFDTFGFTRGQIHSCIPEMVKYSLNHHSAKSAGQMLLFAEDANEDTGTPCDWEEDLAHKFVAYDPMTWLLKESKVLGVFISQHPCTLFREDLNRFSRLQLKDIPKSIGKKSQSVVAFLSGVNERKTKSGKRMATFWLEDHTGSTEAVMFEKELPAEIPSPGIMVCCSLSVSKSFDGQSLSVRLEKINPLETVREEVIKGINLNIVVGANTQRFLTQIKKSLDNFPGSTPVRIILNYERSRVYLKPQTSGLRISDNCLQALKNLDKSQLTVSFS